MQRLRRAVLLEGYPCGVVPEVAEAVSRQTSVHSSSEPRAKVLAAGPLSPSSSLVRLVLELGPSLLLSAAGPPAAGAPPAPCPCGAGGVKRKYSSSLREPRADFLT